MEIDLDNQLHLSQFMYNYTTRLLNPCYVRQILLAEMGRASREEHPIAIILMELDNFNPVLASCAKDIQISILKNITTILALNFRNYDHIFYCNQAKFFIIMPSINKTFAESKAELLRNLIKKSLGGQKNFPTLTASFGVAMFPQHGADIEHLLTSVEQALDQAKKGGGDMVIVATHKN